MGLIARMMSEDIEYYPASNIRTDDGVIVIQCLPSDFSAFFLLSIGDAVRELGRPIRGELRRATAVAMFEGMGYTGSNDATWGGLELAAKSGVVMRDHLDLIQIQKAGTRFGGGRKLGETFVCAALLQCQVAGP
jgi:hypothetical protein